MTCYDEPLLTTNHYYSPLLTTNHYYSLLLSTHYYSLILTVMKEGRRRKEGRSGQHRQENKNPTLRMWGKKNEKEKKRR